MEECGSCPAREPHRQPLPLRRHARPRRDGRGLARLRRAAEPALRRQGAAPDQGRAPPSSGSPGRPARWPRSATRAWSSSTTTASTTTARTWSWSCCPARRWPSCSRPSGPLPIEAVRRYGAQAAAGAAGRARGGRRPPRHQAGQPGHRLLRQLPPGRLRHRARLGRRPHPDRARRDHRQRRVPGPGAGGRRPGRCPLGPLRLRLPADDAAHRPPAVRRRLPGRDPRPAPQRRPRRGPPTAARTCRRTWTSSSCNCWPRQPEQRPASAAEVAARLGGATGAAGCPARFRCPRAAPRPRRCTPRAAATTATMAAPARRSARRRRSHGRC